MSSLSSRSLSPSDDELPEEYDKENNPPENDERREEEADHDNALGTEYVTRTRPAPTTARDSAQRGHLDTASASGSVQQDYQRNTFAEQIVPHTHDDTSFTNMLPRSRPLAPRPMTPESDDERLPPPQRVNRLGVQPRDGNTNGRSSLLSSAADGRIMDENEDTTANAEEGDKK